MTGKAEAVIRPHAWEDTGPAGRDGARRHLGEHLSCQDPLQVKMRV